MRELIAYTEGGLFRVKWNLGGVVNKDLRGGWTSLDRALDAIDRYNLTDSRKKRDPSKHKRAVLAREKRNGEC